MNKNLFSFIISLIASFSTLLGIMPIFISEKHQNKVISFSLAFSASVMITISLFSLIPESLHYIANKICLGTIIIFLIFFIIGIIISSSIDIAISQKLKNSNLYRLGIISILVLIIHNIPEGIMSFLTTTNNLRLGITLSLAIALHNIPEGIAIATPIYYSSYSKRKAIILTSIAGFSELLGAIIAYIFFYKYLNSFLLGIILAITAGIMIHISFNELLPNSIKYYNDEYAVAGFILGSIIMLSTIIIL